jgi:hypothetical protein
MRDDFSAGVKDTLAKRVGVRCSMPTCRKTTYGPHANPTRVVNVGVACHITAASPGGPRYDATLVSSERAAIENGIWLCQTHAKLVDSDTERYTAAVLRNWKDFAEHMTRQELEATNSPNPDLLATSGRLTTILLDATLHFDHMSEAGATTLDAKQAEAAREIEHRLNDVVVDTLALKPNPLFDEADKQETAIAFKSMRAALRLHAFQYQYAYSDYDEDTFRAYFQARQNEYPLGSVEEARTQFVDALERFERLTWLRTLRLKDIRDSSSVGGDQT